MSLSLVQDYSSEEEEAAFKDDTDDSGSEQEEHVPAKLPTRDDYVFVTKNSQDSSLPTPDDLFSEITGPPDFLNPSSAEITVSRGVRERLPGTGYQVIERRQAPPTSVVFESKAKLAYVHERVEDGPANDLSDKPNRAETAADETADLKPVQIPEKDTGKEADKRDRLKVKDKERSKRMKGQSSHATWKSETEMHLRQQFD